MAAMRQSLTAINVAQARAIAQFAPGRWTLAELADGGWIARRGDSVLHACNSRKPRRFGSVDTAIRRLTEELGVIEFVVERLVPAKQQKERATA